MSLRLPRLVWLMAGFCSTQCMAGNILSQLVNAVQLPFIKTAICGMQGPTATGTVILSQPVKFGPVQVSGTITNLTPGQHGFHVHEVGNLSNNCQAAGAHYNPLLKTHGGTITLIRHVGDLGNVNADAMGVATFSITGKFFLLQTVLGRALVVHANPDDLGTGRGAARLESLRTGNAGGRVGCCIITPQFA